VTGGIGLEFPKAIYRDGGSEMLWGKPIETGAVSSREEEVEALANGWRLHPLKPEGDDALTAEFLGEAPKRRGRPPKMKVEDGSA
jgi:hypothetical protein